MENEAHNTLSRMTTVASTMLDKLKEMGMHDNDSETAATVTDIGRKKDASIHDIKADISIRKASLDKLGLSERIRKLQVSMHATI